MNVVETHDLTKIFQTGMKKGNIIALDSVSIEIGPGEIFGLLGPNGAGKTTLVKVLLGIVRATSGESLVNGLPPTDPTSRDKVGFLPENHRFPLHLTGAGLLELAGRMYGMNGTDIRQKISGLLQLVGMDRWGSTKINRYSKGMAQRIGLAQALISDPDLLLLDEPTDGVDPVGKSEIKTVLQRIREQGKSILLNSHLLSEVELVADRVAILNKGKVLRTGSIDDFTTKGLRYEIEATIGNERIEVPEDIGRVIALRTNGMTVELNHVDHLNTIIDRLRLKRISIKAIQPTRISLEQSFLETLDEGGGAGDMRGMIKDSFVELVHRKTIWAFGVVVLICLLAIVATNDLEARFNVGGGDDMDMKGLNEAFGNPILSGFEVVMSIFVFMAIMAVAGLLPRMFEKGRAEFYLSKPIGRNGLLSRKIFAIWFVYGLAIVISGFILYAGVGMFHGVWSSSIILLILLTLGSFMIWLSVLFFFNMLSQSTAMGMMAVFLIWVFEKIMTNREFFKSVLDSKSANYVIDGLYYIMPKPAEVSGIFFKISAGTAVETWMPLWSTAVVSLVLLYLSTFIFRRRDY